jgi:hypothetical protein
MVIYLLNMGYTMIYPLVMVIVYIADQMQVVMGLMGKSSRNGPFDIAM